MSAIGPVEEGPGPGRPRDTAADIVGSGPPRRSPRVRRALRALSVLAVAALLGLAVAGALGRDRTPRTARATGRLDAVSYTGRTTPDTPGGRTFTLRIRMTAAPGPAVTVTDVHHPFTGLTTHTQPTPPFTVSPRHPRDITLHITVDNCALTPIQVRLPFLDVTLRETGGPHRSTVVLDRSYATDVTRTVAAICRATAP